MWRTRTWDLYKIDLDQNEQPDKPVRVFQQLADLQWENLTVIVRRSKLINPEVFSANNSIGQATSVIR
jgi:hypothetical protein